MSFGSFFGKLGKVLFSPVTATKVGAAGAVVSEVNPGLGALIELIANAAYQIEMSAFGSGASGATKKDMLKSVIDTAAPLILQVLSNVAGKPVDPNAVAPALDKLIDDVVAVFNSTGVFTHAPAAPAPQPAK